MATYIGSWILELILMAFTCPAVLTVFVQAPWTARVLSGNSADLLWRWSAAVDRVRDRYDFNFLGLDGGMPATLLARRIQNQFTTYDTRIAEAIPDSTSIGFNMANIGVHDAGTYQCVFYPFTGQGTSNNSAIVFLYERPNQSSVTSTPQGGVTEGESLTLTCSSESNSVPASQQPGLTYSWTRTGQTLPPDGRHDTSERVDGGRLVIDAIHRSDQDSYYQCVAAEQGSNLPSEASAQEKVNVNWLPSTPVASSSAVGPVVDRASVTLYCTIGDFGKPPATVAWLKDNTDYAASQQNLTFVGVAVDDHDGSWTCKVANAATPAYGLVSNAVTLTIYENPRVSESPVSKTVVNTEELSGVLCEYSGRPAVSVRWESSSGSFLSTLLQYEESSVISGKRTTTTSTLMWATTDQAARRGASGVYHCVGSNQAAADVNSNTMSLNVEYGPYSTSTSPMSDSLNEGVEASCSCATDCVPGCLYQWTKQSNTTFSRAGELLQISATDRYDQGVFTCEGYNDHGRMGSTYTLTVNYAPTLDVTQSTQEAQEGDTAHLICDVNSRPWPTASQLNWFNGTSAMEGTSRTESQVTVQLNNVDCPDAGTFQCRADNGVASATDDVILQIECSPTTVETEPSNRLAGSALGDTVTFKVMFYANPDPTLNWEFVHTLNDSTGDWPPNVETVNEESGVSQVIITNVAEHNFGKYIFNATNTIGSLRGGPMDFELQAYGPPTAPSDLKLDKATSASMILSWIRGVDGGPTQTFWLNYVDMETGEFYWEHAIIDDALYDTGTIMAKVTQGIVPSREYKFTLGAINEKGNVTSAEQPTFQSQEQPRFADKPDIIIAGNKAIIYWSIDNVDQATMMVVECCITDTTNCVNETFSDMSVSPVEMDLPAGGTQYVFAFFFYNDVDLVNSWRIIIGTQVSPDVGLIVGVIVAALVVVIAITILIVFIRRGKLPTIGRVNKADEEQTIRTESQGHCENVPLSGKPVELATLEAGASSALPPEQASHENDTVSTSAEENTRVGVYEEIKFNESNYQQLETVVPIMQQTSEYAHLVPQLLEIQANDIVIGDVIHRGSMWTIKMAQYRGSNVILKRVSDNGTLAGSGRDILRAEVAGLLSAGRHEHLLHLLGTTTNNGNDYMAVRYEQQTDLQSVLWKKRSSPEYENLHSVLTPKLLIRLSLDVATGMKYLHSKHLVHPSLRARKVLVGDDNVCKIYGFTSKGDAIVKLTLERERNALPTRWLAPEVIQDCENINAKSDVWSFGVLLWEIYTLGNTPYDGISAEDVATYVNNGNVLPKPEHCSMEIYELMKRCWMATLKFRLSLDEAWKSIEELAQQTDKLR